MTTYVLDTSKQHCYVYTTEGLHIEVLGGIRIDSLDRLRVTLKLQAAAGEQHSNIAIRHNLDLYNEPQVDKLVRKTAEKLEVGSLVVSKAIASLTDALEKYRLQEMENQQKEDNKRVILTDLERKEALKFLKQPYLLQQTNDLIGKSGVVGEENNRLLMYLVFTSRKREQPLHVISLGSSGTGKSHLQEKVGELTPPEDKIEITTLSENALYYFGKQELQHKLVLIEDLDGAGEVLYPLRELQSKKVITKSIAYKNTAGETQTIHLRVEGPVSVAGCTTKESIYEDNANRSFLIYLDESKEQDDRVMNYQRKKSAGKINTKEEKEARRLLQNVQRVLQPVAVRNPYAELLQLPSSIFKPRRTNAHYLQFMEVVTFYHQYQREQKKDEVTGESYIESTLEDIEQANRLMKEILLRKSDDLNGACRDFLVRVGEYLQSRNESSFTNRSISKGLHIPITTVKRHNLALLLHGYIEKYPAASDAKGFNYCLTPVEDYHELQSSITTVLDNILNDLKANHQPTSPLSAHFVSEPLKARPSKEKSFAAQQPTGKVPPPTLFADHQKSNA